MLRPLLAAALVAAAFGATAAQAACVGTYQIEGACVTTHRGALPGVDLEGDPYEDCVLVNGRCVAPFSVPMPRVVPGDGEPLVEVSCGTCG
ncbi:MAG TPA: hypothetical protein VGX28_03685 [Frankiaceae bacterium]|jgi:hypothetical protein|nr:hypothetical protein [Frankiaceae bacterium]